MATVDCPHDYEFGFGDPKAVPRQTSPRRGLHRIAEVRQQQQVSLRNVARRLGISITDARRQEQAESDLSLSQLHCWQQVLNVPVAELLVEAEGQLAGPVLERSRMVRLMKTAAAIRERTRGTSIERLVTRLMEQLVELMPEVEGVTSWPDSGQSRRRDDFGRTACNPVSEELFRR